MPRFDDWVRDDADSRGGGDLGGGLGSGSGGGGGLGGGVVVSATDPRTIEYARILDLVSEGPIVGLVDGLKSVYLDDTPVQNADGSLNFDGLILQSTQGTGTQAPIPGFPSTETETSVNTKLSVSGGSVTRTISTAGISAVRVKIGIPALKVINQANGKESGSTVQVKVEIQSASYNGGVWTQAKLDGDYVGTIAGKFGARYTRSYRVALPAAGPWQVRVTRLTADAPDAYTQNETWWDSYTELTDARLSYPYSAMFALEVDAQQFRSIPRRAYEIKGRIVKVPSNYDPETRAYAGIWSGTFKDAWTDNPAWIFYDLATNTRYGAGNYLDASLLDKWSLYQCAQYCDEMVDDGRGGTEPRFTCNLYIQTQEEAIRVLTNLLGIFRAMAYEAGGTIVPVQDAPSDPVAIFTNSNVRDGAFTYSGTSRRQRHTAAIVGWNDPNDGYRLVPEVVEDQAGIARYGYQPMEATALGCTSQGQARRYGLWLLASEMTETESVSFTAALEGAAVAPGEVIQINDQHRAGSVRWGGRIVSATTTAVTLDAPVTLGAGAYTLKCTLPNGTVESRAVSTGAGTHSALTVGTAYSQAPGAQAQWLLQDAAVTPRLYRVVSIGEGDGLEHEILAVEHNPAKYAAVESGLTLGPGVSGGTKSLVPVTGLTLGNFVELRFGARIQNLTAKWNPAAGAIGYHVMASRDYGPWEPMAVSGASASKPGAEEGTYRVRASAVYQGGVSRFVEASTTVLESTAVPSGLGSAADVAAAQSTADSAASAASAAQSSANSANAALADISSDGKLTPVEKQRARLEWDTILAERSGIQGQADTFGVSRTAYDSAFQTLANYLNAGTAWASGAPSWLADANLGTTTTIVGSTFRDNWKALYDARQALLNAVADKARQNAAAAQSSADTAASAAAYADALARSSYNLIKNGNSEDVFPAGSPEMDHRGGPDASAARNGSYLRAILNWSGTSRTGYGEWIDWTAPIQCSPGDKFYFEFWARKYNWCIPATSVLNASWRSESGSEIGNTITTLALTTTYQKHSSECEAPAGAAFVVFASGDLNTPNTQELWFDDAYACRKIAAGMIEADAVQTIHLNAYAVTASKIATDAVKTSNYAEDAYGNPTAGVWMGVNTTQPIKCGPNGLKIGKGIFNQQSLIFERIVNGIFWSSAQGWSLDGAQPPTWSSANPRITGTGNVVTTNSTTIPPDGSGSVTATGSASQLLNLPSLDPNQSAYNLTLWLGSDYTLKGAGALFDGITAYAKVYLTNLGTGGSETLIGTLNISTPDAYTQGTFDLSAVYTAPGAYGLRIEISASANAYAGISASATLTARARLADVKFTA